MLDHWSVHVAQLYIYTNNNCIFIVSAQFALVGGNKRWGSTCTYDFYSPPPKGNVRFFSPGYPQNYPPGVNCQYVFNANENERVRITFQNIQLESIDGR